MGRRQDVAAKKRFVRKIRRLWKQSCKERNRKPPVDKVTEDLRYSKIYLLDFKSFSIWQSIRQRTREGGVYQARWPAYVGSTMSEEWSKDFQAFANWYTSQIGYAESWDVDKDALTDSKQYGSQTCILLPREVNVLFCNRNYRFPIQKSSSRYLTKDNQSFETREDALLHALEMRMKRISALELKYKNMIPEFIFTKLRNIDYLSINQFVAPSEISS